MLRGIARAGIVCAKNLGIATFVFIGACSSVPDDDLGLPDASLIKADGGRGRDSEATYIDASGPVENPPETDDSGTVNPFDKDACSASCINKKCGDPDGCGGTCATGGGCCVDQCTANAIECANGIAKMCVNTNSDPCLEWQVTPCPSGSCQGNVCQGCTPTCAGKKCGDPDGCNAGGTCAAGSGCCQDECTLGQTTCSNGFQKTCAANNDSDICLEFQSTQGVACPSGTCNGNQCNTCTPSCSGKECGTVSCNQTCSAGSGCCTQDCNPGDIKCRDSNTYYSCGSVDADDCRDWTAAFTTVPQFKVCSNNQLQSCGGNGETCCPTSTGSPSPACQSGLTCDAQAGFKCVAACKNTFDTCGGANGSCCAGKTCTSGRCCVNAGQPFAGSSLECCSHAANGTVCR